MNESHEILESSSEDVTSNFATGCREQALWGVIFTSLEVGMLLVEYITLKALGVKDISIPFLTAASTPPAYFASTFLLIANRISAHGKTK